MANFESAVNYCLAHEQGLVDNSADPGGITNFGISLRFLREIPEDRLRRYSIFSAVTDQTIRDLTLEQAKLIYRGEFWEQAPFEKIMNQILCNYIFDMCVNHGISDGIKIVQRAIWAAQKKKEFVKDDGLLGAYTLQAINQGSFILQSPLIAERAGYMRLIAAIKPHLAVFLDGWLNRCYAIK